MLHEAGQGGTSPRYPPFRRRNSLAACSSGFTPEAGGPARVRVSLAALGQAQLLETADDGEFLSVRLLPVQGKAELQATPVMRRLQTAAEGK